ncbi:MAG: hypothetical protein JJ891_16810 [Rhizobiaceae bacterium]|nr:hypothetical protein [Rhizobiaceae bacterium]
MASDEGTPVARQLVKAKAVWETRNHWNRYIQNAYDYALPHRQNVGKTSTFDIDKLTDMTAPMGAMYFAGNLQKDLFPAASSKFTYEAGPLLQNELKARELIVLEKEYQGIANRVDPFFQSGDFDTSANEACMDLGIGTGAIMPVHGDKHQPLFFANVPFENLACKGDLWGRLTYISWKQRLTIEEIHYGFRDTGRFSDAFMEQLKSKPNDELEIYQDFWKTAHGWIWVAYTEKYCTEFIIEARTRTQPIAVMRYFRGPGEPYGRGPILLGMPTIMTLNKAQELALRSAAVQLLGIWGYRTGGTFNPDTAHMGPGEFWPMMSTGGQFGPDVQRLDPATANFNIARVVIDGMRDDIKGLLLDNRLEQKGLTPPSASQIVASLQDRADANIGAFGRLSRESMPVLAPRATEILYEQGYIQSPVQLNELLVTTKVRSPMQQALDARKLEASVTYFDMVTAIAGPQNSDEHIKADEVLADARKVLDIDHRLAPSNEERQSIRQQKQQQIAVATAAEYALEAAKIPQDQQAQGAIA